MTEAPEPVSGADWQRLDPAAQAVTPILDCAGCGAVKHGPTGDPTDVFPSQRCSQCPPWPCEDCGEMCSATALCSCWTDLTAMAHADVKALFAEDGRFNVAPDGTLSVAAPCTCHGAGGDG